MIHIINPRIQEILGRENDKNNYEVAYKFTEESTFSILEDIEFNTGLFGRIAPVARIKPVTLKSRKIEFISLGSIGRLTKLNLRKGDKVKVLYDIIPYLSFDDECEHNEDGELINIPTTCPDCGEELTFSESGAIATCENNECPCRKKGKILNYLSKMQIKGISYGIVSALYDAGFLRSIKDIYKLDRHSVEISNLRGFGVESVNALLASIDSRTTVQDSVLLGSIGITDVSTKTFSKVLQEYSLEELLEIVENKEFSKLVILRGIQEATAKKIIEGVSENLDLIEYLEKELIVIDTKSLVHNSDFSVYFTKISNDEKEDWVRQHNGEVAEDFTKSVTFLVVPSLDIESAKIPKAKKWGMPVIPVDNMEEEILEYLKNKR